MVTVPFYFVCVLAHRPNCSRQHDDLMCLLLGQRRQGTEFLLPVPRRKVETTTKWQLGFQITKCPAPCNTKHPNVTAVALRYLSLKRFVPVTFFSRIHLRTLFKCVTSYYNCYTYLIA